jgi:hypothetical protein
MSMVTHEPGMQPLLPQVLVGNEKVFTQALMKSMKPKLPRNFVMLRKKSAWNCHATMREILSLLAKALKKVMEGRSVILILDVHSSHFDISIFAHARRLGVRLVYVPASLTFLLQPCDTHVFAVLKQVLRKAWQKRVSQNSTKPSKEEWLEMIFRSVRSVLQGTKWESAFLATGALASQTEVSPRTFSRMGLVARPVVPPGPPTAEQAALIFPRGRKLNVMSYVLWCTAKEVKLVKVPTGAGAGSSASSSSAGSVGGSGVVTKTKGKFATWVLAKKKHS